jgi:hypothetical protein
MAAMPVDPSVIAFTEDEAALRQSWSPKMCRSLSANRRDRYYAAARHFGSRGAWNHAPNDRSLDHKGLTETRKRWHTCFQADGR